jgi:hypothetical protein
MAATYIHIKTGKPYFLIDPNAMMKVNGEWKKGFVIYQPANENKNFIRTQQDFFDNFEEASSLDFLETTQS